MDRKYFKPKSLTWWSGFVPILVGLFIATVDIHGFASWVNAINEITGGVKPALLVNAGLGVIGYRGAIGDKK